MNVTLFGNRVFAGIQVKLRSEWIRVDPNLMTGVLTGKEKYGHRDTHREHLVMIEEKLE